MMGASMLARPWVGMLALFLITRDNREMAISSVLLLLLLLSVDIATRIATHRRGVGDSRLMLNVILAASDFNPVDEFTQFVKHPYIDLPGQLDINKAVIYLWMASALSIILVLLVTPAGAQEPPRQAADGDRGDLRRLPQPDRARRPAGRGDCALVSLHRDAVCVHLDEQRDRVHSAAVRR